jgi:hypothetical protein
MLRLLIFLLPLLFALEAPQTTAYQVVTVHDGPSFTFRDTGSLNPGVPINIIERSRAGTWVHITRTTPAGEVVLDGWTVTGYLNYDGNFHLSEIPVNETITDADPANVEFVSVGELYAVPVISKVSTAMLGVYKYGQALGNHSAVVTKVGDSVSANPLYLNPMSRDDYDLGPYDFLEDTIQYFGPSLSSSSVASRIGMTTYVVFDPLWADKEQCQPGESPLQCEYRLKRPSIAMILFGPNDVRHMTDAEFDVQIRQLVDESLELGVIPVLSTFTVDPDDALWWQSINFNLRLSEIAADTEVPLMNFWSAARLLPDYGLDEDAIHVANSGFPNLRYSTGHEAWYGTSLQNLLAMVMLDELRRALDMN